MKTITQGFLFSFQGGGKWSTPEGGIQWSGLMEDIVTAQPQPQPQPQPQHN